MSVIKVGRENYTDQNLAGDDHKTIVNLLYPSDGTGVLDTIYIYSKGWNVASIMAGTLYGAVASLSVRDYVNLGTFPTYTAQVITVTGLAIDVNAGDFFGIYSTDRTFLRYSFGSEAGCNYSGNHFTEGGSKSYTLWDSNPDIFSTGKTVSPPSSEKTIGIKMGNLFVNKVNILTGSGWTEGKIN